MKIKAMVTLAPQIVLLCALLGCVKESEQSDAIPAAPGGAWPIFRGDASLSGRAEARLPGRLELAFRLETGDSVSSSPVIGNGLLYVCTDSGTLIAFDLATRARRWEQALPDASSASPLLVPGANIVAVGGMDGGFQAFAADSGALKWRAATDLKIVGSANAAPSGAAGAASLIVGSYDNSLYRFALDSGKKMWTFETENYVNGTPALSDGRAVFGGCDARLYMVDLGSGKQTSAVDTGAYIAGSTACLDGIAYVGNYAGRFLAIDVVKGAVLWSFSLPDKGKGFSASPAVADKHVVIGGKDSILYCLARATGKPVWKRRAGAEYQSSPVVGGDRVLAVAADGEIVVVELASGRTVARYELGAEVTGSPAVAAGLIAVSALDGNVYVFGGE